MLQGMARETQRAEHLPQHVAPIGSQRSHQPPVGSRVAAQLGGGRCHRALHQDRAAVIQRMRDGGGREDPLETVVRQWEIPKERRCHAERMDRRANVMHEAGQRQLGRACPPADRLFAFNHQHRAPGARQGDGRSQPVGTGADDNGVMRWTMAHFDFIGLT